MLRYILFLFLATASFAQSMGTGGSAGYVIAGGTGWDLFGRLRVSEPYTLFDSAEVGRADTGTFWDYKEVGAATVSYNTNQASHTLSVTTASGDRAVRQTKEYFHYEPGKAFTLLATGVIGNGQANTEANIGYMDDNNGLFFQNLDGQMQFVRRTYVTGSAVDNPTIQSDWIDPLDGTGPSRVVVDWTKTQIFWLSFEWLGVGSVQFGIVHNGSFIVCGQLNHNNQLEEVYMSTGCLPVRYEVKNNDVAAAGYDLTQICSSVFVEGGYNPAGLRSSANTGNAAVGSKTTGAFRPLIAVRHDPDKSVRTTILPASYQISTDGAGDYRYELRVGGTVTGGSWADVDDESNVEYNNTLTSHSGGHVISSGYATGANNQSVTEASAGLSSDLSVVSDIDGNPGVMVLGIYPLSTTTVTGATVGWKEVH